MSYRESPCPSRCVSCNSRMLKSYGCIQDTFGDAENIGWQCVACGVVMETEQVGKTVKIQPVGIRRITLAPGELRTLRRESAERSK